MLDLGALKIKIKVDKDGAINELKDTKKEVNGTSKSLEGLGNKASLVAKAGLAVLAVGTAKLISIGSQYNGEVQQTAFLLDRLDTSTQSLIKAKSKEAKVLGMSQKQYTDSATQMGTFMKSMGLTAKEANNLIPKMVQLTADGSAFANIPMEEAMSAISSASMGNYEALGKLNIEMSDALINNSSYAKELGKTTQQMTSAEKTQAIYNTMLERGGHLTGFAESESGSFATQLQQTKQKVYETAGAIGEQLLPALTPLIEKAGDLAVLLGEKLLVAIDWVKEHSEILIPILSGLLAGFLAFKVITTVVKWFKLLRTAMLALNVAMLANPIGIVVAIIGVLIAVGVALYRNWDTIKKKASQLWNAIKTIFGNIKNWIVHKFNEIINKIKGFSLVQAGKDLFTGLWNGLKSVWTNIKSWVSDKVSWLVDKLAFWRKGKKEMEEKPDGKHRNGLRYVPYDDYTAELHKGEMVLTASEARRYAQGQSAGTTTQNTVNFNGSYSFRDTNDIDYFMNEAGKLIKRREVIC